MYAIAFNGSPRKGGNTETMLRTVLDTLGEASWETELFQLGGQTIRGCQFCSRCFKNKDRQCVMKDDCFAEAFEKILRADAIIVGSPAFYSGVTAEVKALLDRAGYVSLANNRLLKGKVGAAAVAMRRGGGMHAFDTINHMYLMSQMVVPGSVFWNFGIGVRRGDVNKDAEGIINMKNLGQTIDVVARALHPYVADWPTAPGY